MRLVTFAGTCNEKGPAAYTSNDTTAFTVLKGSIGGLKVYTDQLFAIGANASQIIRKQGVQEFPNGADQKSVFVATYGMPMFKYLQKNADAKQAFDDFMTQRRVQNTMHWSDRYPVEKLLGEDLKTDKDAVLLVDVGGSKGHDVVKFQHRFPNMPGQLILQDLPETIRNIEDPPEGIVLMGHDFFTPQPVKG